jgi:hypothetical protein
MLELPEDDLNRHRNMLELPEDDLNRDRNMLELPEDDLNRDRNMLERFKCFNINVNVQKSALVGMYQTQYLYI